MEIHGRTALGAKILAVLLASTLLYWRDLSIVANEALNSDLSTHILALPFLLGYILYRLRRMFSASASWKLTGSSVSRSLPYKEVMGSLLCLLAYFIRWYGSLTFLPLEYNLVSLPLFVSGLILVVFNSRTLRALLIPIAFLVFLIPPPLKLARSAGLTLAIFSSRASYIILKGLGLPVTISIAYDIPIIFLTTPSGQEISFAIDLACSGLYSLIGFALFAVFTAYLARGSLLKRTFIFMVGLPLIYGLNILRITLIVSIGHLFGADLALSTFHLFGGWVLILVGTLILLLLSERTFKVSIFGSIPGVCPECDGHIEGSACSSCGRLLRTPYVKLSGLDTVKLILISGIALSLLFFQVPVFTLTKGEATVSIMRSEGEVATTILPEIEGYDLRFVYRDVRFENISGQDASIFYVYQPENRSKNMIWVGLEIGATRGILHRWEGCLITWPLYHGREVHVTQLDLRDIQLLENPPLSARYFAYYRNYEDETQVILYWYTRSVFRTDEGYREKWVKISVIEYSENLEEIRAVEDELLPVAEAIANYWEPISKWSQTTLAIARDGPTLILVTAASLVATIVYSIYNEIRRRRRGEYAYSLVSNTEEIQILNAIKMIEKTPITRSNIASKYQEAYGMDIDMDILSMKLLEAEETGIIERKIVNINDEPHITWKVIF